MTAPNTIGNLNGWWAIALKMQLTIFPLFVGGCMAWGTWVTRAVFILDPETPRYSFADAAREHSELWRAMDARLDALPPQDWRIRIMNIEDKLGDVRDNQTKILTKLGETQ